MLEIHQPVPDFQLPTLEGGLFSLVEVRGRIVVLNFWSAECPWAERTDALLAEWKRTWGEGVKIFHIAANANESPDLLRRIAAERRLELVLVDTDHRIADLYAAKTTPHVYVIDENGLLRYQGGVDDVTFRRREPSRFYLQEAVEALLAGLEPPIQMTPPYGCTIF